MHMMYNTFVCYIKRGVAQLGRVPEWGSGGRWFESSHSDHVEAKESFASIFLQKNHPPASLLLLFHKKSRSVRLFGCKRPHDDSLSLPTFCEFYSEHVMNTRTKKPYTKVYGFLLITYSLFTIP